MTLNGYTLVHKLLRLLKRTVKIWQEINFLSAAKNVAFTLKW